MLKGEELVESDTEIEAAGNEPAAGSDEGGVGEQIEQFNKSVKEEKMLERLEKLMNEGEIVLAEGSKLLEYLKKRDYLALFSSMIGKPHQYQSATAVYNIFTS